MDAVKHKLGDPVCVDIESLAGGNREYWRTNAGDGRGVVELRNGQRVYVRFATGLAGWFDDAVVAGWQGELFA